MTTIAELYERANTLWPNSMPPLTYPEAVRAAKRLYRFVRGKRCDWEFREASGRVGTWMGAGQIFHINPAGDGGHVGWDGLIHNLSHWLYYQTPGYDKPHSKGHARLEARMIKQVLRRGWLSGALQDKPKVPKKADELARIDAKAARWQSKLKRAQTALRKLARQRKYYEKKLARGRQAVRLNTPDQREVSSAQLGVV